MGGGWQKREGRRHNDAKSLCDSLHVEFRAGKLMEGDRKGFVLGARLILTTREPGCIWGARGVSLLIWRWPRGVYIHKASLPYT